MLRILKDVASYVMLKTESGDTDSAKKVMEHFCPADFTLVLAHEYHEDYKDLIEAKDSDRLREVLKEHEDALQEMHAGSSAQLEPVGLVQLNLCFFKLRSLTAVLT